MTKKIKAAIMKALEEYGVEPASKGYSYVMDAIAFIVEKEL